MVEFRVFLRTVVLLAFSMAVSAQDYLGDDTGTCWITCYPIIGDESSACYINVTSTVCSLYPLTCLGSAHITWTSGVYDCNYNPPPSACMITSGEFSGFCMDVLSVEECNDLGEFDNSTTQLFVNASCIDFVGACRFTEMEGITVDENLCSPQYLGSTVTWLGDECCIENVLEISNNATITQGICETYLKGTFQGIGSTCDTTTTTSTTTTTTTLPCVQEGASAPVVPGAPSCCPGLTTIGCESPGIGGFCEPCTGAIYCTNCGNGLCGPGENICNCPQDCEPATTTTTSTTTTTIPQEVTCNSHCVQNGFTYGNCTKPTACEGEKQRGNINSQCSAKRESPGICCCINLSTP